MIRIKKYYLQKNENVYGWKVQISQKHLTQYSFEHSIQSHFHTRDNRWHEFAVCNMRMKGKIREIIWNTMRVEFPNLAFGNQKYVVELSYISPQSTFSPDYYTWAYFEYPMFFLEHCSQISCSWPTCLLRPCSSHTEVFGKRLTVVALYTSPLTSSMATCSLRHLFRSWGDELQLILETVGTSVTSVAMVDEPSLSKFSSFYVPELWQKNNKISVIF